MKTIAMDIGGTNIKAGIADGEGGLSNVITIPTEAEKGFGQIRANMFRAIESLFSYGAERIAVSSAGNIDHKRGRVIYATENLPGFTGYEIRQDIVDATGLDTFVINDGYAALMGEYYLGAARGADNCVMLTFGTGIGGAAIVSGRLMTGADYGAARLGHLTLYPDGRECTCGRRGCAEQYISAGALARTAGCTLEKLFGQGESDILTAFNSDLELFFDNVVNIFDPGLIVIGGGLVHFAEHFLPALQNKYKATIKPAELRNNAGMLGACIAMDNI